MNVVADFVFGSDDEPSGIFVFEKGGLLAGLEVYGLAGDAPKTLRTLKYCGRSTAGFSPR